MKPVDRQKMCPNCDGRVAYDVTQCPYCFAILQVENSPPPKSMSPASSQDNLSALYTPPYSSKPAEAAAPKAALHSEKENISFKEASDSKIFLPILLLTLASNLFTLGILQFFFSDHGVVRLEINANYWFLMLFVSLPLFYLGWKKLSQE